MTPLEKSGERQCGSAVQKFVVINSDILLIIKTRGQLSKST